MVCMCVWSSLLKCGQRRGDDGGAFKIPKQQMHKQTLLNMVFPHLIWISLRIEQQIRKLLSSVRQKRKEKEHLLPCGPKNFTTNSLSPLRMVTSCLLSMLLGR